jgi:transposase, IS5 family
MLRTVGDQPTLWESLLPREALVMPAELVRVDALLDDDRFFAPFGEFFHATLGRPSIPIEAYLRLMFLKYRYRLGFETLCREVTDSITWQRFCRIPLGGRVPHPTTLMKITTRCGQVAVDGLNEALLAKAVEAKVLKTNRVRADTTVIEANVAYPSGSSLLAKGVAKMAATAKKLRAMGLATRTKLADKTRSVRSRARSINANLRRRSDDRLVEVRRINADLAGIAERVAGQADKVMRNARRTLRTLGDQASGRARAAVAGLERTAALTRRVAAQTRQRLAGETPHGATRVVSLHDADARPIAKGRLGKPVEFGYKAQLVDNEDGVIVDHNIEQGNPPDAPMLKPAIERIKKRTGRAPRAVTADRGYGERGMEDDLRDAGVRHVVLPTKGKPTAARRQVENRRAFRKMVRWRTGCEGRISCAKRDFGLNRTRIDGLAGVRTWPRRLRPQPGENQQPDRVTEARGRRQPEDRAEAPANQPDNRPSASHHGPRPKEFFRTK